MHKKSFGGTFSVQLHHCQDEIPPSRKTSNVTPLGTIECTLDVPFSSLRDFISPSGEKAKKMDYEVRTVPSGATVEFAVSIDGRRLGKSISKLRFE